MYMKTIERWCQQWNNGKIIIVPVAMTGIVLLLVISNTKGIFRIMVPGVGTKNDHEHDSK